MRHDGEFNAALELIEMLSKDTSEAYPLQKDNLICPTVENKRVSRHSQIELLAGRNSH